MGFPPTVSAAPGESDAPLVADAPVVLGDETRAPSRLVYGWAAIVGVIFTFHVLGWDFLSGRPEVVRRMAGDPAAGLAAFRIYVDDAWQWPLLATSSFGDDGVNVAFSDSIPVLALVAKLARPLGVAAETWWAVWFWLIYPLQAIAATFAVRAWGARSTAVGAVAPVLCLTMPVLLRHSVHPSLSAHFVLLLAWGLAGRMATRQVPAGSDRRAFSAVALAALAIHPYLAVMVVAMLTGSAVDAWARGRVDLSTLGRWLTATAGLLLAWLAVGGYLGAAGGSDGGYGLYATHLTGPIRPVMSDLIPADPFGPDLDPALPAYSYLGVGLLVLSGAAMLGATVRLRRWALRNQGLVAALAVLAAWAVSPYVYYWSDDPVDIPTRLAGAFGSYRTAGVAASLIALAAAAAGVWQARRLWRTGGPGAGLAVMAASVAALGGAGLLAPGIVDALTEQFRASGRFAWPALYGVPVLALVASERFVPRASAATTPARRALFPALLFGVAALQVADTTTLRAETRNILIPGGEARSQHVAHLVALVDAHDSVHLGPDFRCTYYPDGVAAFVDITQAASAAGRPINRIYAARADDDGDCRVPQDIDLTDPAQLVVMIEPVSLLNADNVADDAAGRCRKRDTINVCSHRWDRLDPQLAEYFGGLDD